MTANEALDWARRQIAAGERVTEIRGPHGPGLNVEEETFEAFVDVVLDIAPELIGGELIGSKIVFEREVELAAE
jgi:hypothetical protein